MPGDLCQATRAPARAEPSSLLPRLASLDIALTAQIVYDDAMKVPRVYLDTSVLGGCFDAAFGVWSLKLLDEVRDGRFIPVLSDLVAIEVATAPANVQTCYVDVTSRQAEILAVTDAALDLADQYQRRGILTAKFANDGLHIAMATVADVDLLVSWNFKHIVHFDKIRRFNAVNLEFGYKPIQIFSPREVISYDDE